MKRNHKVVFSISLLLVCTCIFLVFYILKNGSGIATPTKYDKYIKQDMSGLTNQEIYEKDLKFIYEEIKNNYVNLDYKEKTFNFNWDDLYTTYSNKIKTINNEKDFYAICSEYISNLRDGHVSFSPNGDIGQVYGYRAGLKSAFDVRMIQGKPIVVRAHKKINIIGDEIVSINGVDFLNIVDTMTKYHYHGGNDISARTGILTSNYFYNYFSYFNDKYPDKLNIVLKDRYGAEKTISINTNNSFDSASLEVDNDINFGFYKENQLPSSKIIDNVGYILIPTFNIENKGSIDNEFNKTIIDFKNNNVKGVVIDLRYNTGGNDSFRDILGYLTTKKIYINNYRFRDSERFKDIYYLRTLYEDIRSKSNTENMENGYTKWWSWEINPNKEQYLTTVPVVVLSNEGIFSSTDSFVNTCLNFKLATVIGNMVPLSGNGLPTPIVLPSKKYILSYGFLESRDIDYKYTENIVKEPDIKVTQTLDDYYKGIDSQLEKAIEFIDNKKDIIN